MSFDLESLLPNPLLSAVILAITACVDVWVWLAVRWRQQPPALPYEPRRPVPWRGAGVLLILMAWYFIPPLVMQASRVRFHVPVVAESECAEDAPIDKTHSVQRALSETSHSAWPAVLAALLAIAIAPITEELVFRLLLQGWLESVERRARRQLPWLRRIVVGVVPVAIVAMLFAAIHIRPARPREDLSTVVLQLQSMAVASLLVVALLVGSLKFAAGATLADFGIVPRKLARDVRLGLLAFLAVTPPVYAVLLAVHRLLPELAVADPIPLLFLGLALGGLYCRTHRIVPSIVLHSAFNAVGVFLALAGSS